MSHNRAGWRNSIIAIIPKCEIPGRLSPNSEIETGNLPQSLGHKRIEKISTDHFGYASIFSIRFCSKILRHLAGLNFGIRAKRKTGTNSKQISEARRHTIPRAELKTVAVPLEGERFNPKSEIETGNLPQSLGHKRIEKISTDRFGYASIFSIRFCSNLLRHLAGLNFGFRVEKARAAFAASGSHAGGCEGVRLDEGFRAEEKARGIVLEELQRRAGKEKDLAGARKGDKSKVALARRLRAETTMSLKWIAQRLHMGSWTCVSNLLREK